MDYYAGQWQGHKIIVINGDNEKLLLDGAVVAETKPGLRFASVLQAELPGTNGLFLYAMLSSTHSCYCIVGKPLKAEYDKSTRTFSAEYNGHTIEAVNKMKPKLILDGTQVDEDDNQLRDFVILGTGADENGKRFMSVHDAATGGLKVKCDLYAEAENVRMIRCERVGGELVPKQADDSSSFITGFIIGSL